MMILAVALVLRLPFALVSINHHADEIWQYLEQAYGLAFGRAVIPWEYREQIRSWLLPSAMALPIRAGRVAEALGLGLLLPLRLLCTLLSLTIVVAAYRMGGTISRRHALLCGIVTATSFELAYFAPRALSDSIAVALFMSAAWLLVRPSRSVAHTALAGFLLGLCFCVRFQLAPAIAVFVLASLRWDRRAWQAAIAGGLIALLVDGAADLINGAIPFRWLIRNIWLNIVVDRSALYGIEPPQWYCVELVRIWTWACPPLIVLAIIGARRNPALFLAALVNVLFHSFIPHKEYRFILLSVTIILILAAMGSVDVAHLLRHRIKRSSLTIVTALFWAAVPVIAATSAGGREQWKSLKRFTSLMKAAHHERGACGLAFFQPTKALAAAYVYYDRDTPIYVFRRANDVAEATRRASNFNLVVTSPDRIRFVPGRYALRHCFSGPRDQGSRLPFLPDRCLYVRPGGCTPAPDHRFDINTVVREQNE